MTRRPSQAGGLPPAAERRLRQLTAEGSALFTSNLSVREFALGADPVAHVTGSAVFNITWQTNQWRTGPLDTQTAALNRARDRALERLEQEARIVGADAVVGIEIIGREHDFGVDATEWIASGTAVRLPHAVSGPALLSGLGMAEHSTLRLAGYEPAGFLAASTVYYVVASAETVHAQMSMRTEQNNQELAEFTAGVYAARELVMSDLIAQTSGLACDGIVGVEVDHHIAAVETNRSGSSGEDLIVTFHVSGTAIRATGQGPASPDVRLAVRLDSDESDD